MEHKCDIILIMILQKLLYILGRIYIELPQTWKSYGLFGRTWLYGDESVLRRARRQEGDA